MWMALEMRNRRVSNVQRLSIRSFLLVLDVQCLWMDGTQAGIVGAVMTKLKPRWDLHAVAPGGP
jgi:hypothetical protein